MNIPRKKIFSQLARTTLSISLLIGGLTRGSAAESIFESSSSSLDTLQKKISVYTLDNGLRVVMYPRGVAPIFSAVTTVGVGGVDEHVGETGIAHMFEHMAFKGTKTIGTSDYTKEKPLLDRLEDLAAQDPSFQSITAAEKQELGSISKQLSALWRSEEFSVLYEKQGSVDLNAQTDKDHTTYLVSLPKSAFEFWAQTESARLREPVLRQFYSERDVVLEERRMRYENEPAATLSEMVLQKAFQVHPYRTPSIGYEDDIRHLTARKLEAFRKQYYVPSNIVISVVGSVDPDKDIEVIKRYFSDISKSALTPPPVEVEPPQTKETQFTYTADASPLVYIAYHKPNFPHPDDAILSVLGQMLAGSSQSPLYDLLVKKEQIATQVSQTEAPGDRFPNLMWFALVPRHPHTNQELMARFDQIMDRSLENFSEEQLTQAKKAIAVSYLSQMKSNISLAQTLSSVELGYGNWEAMITWYQEVLAVTLGDIQRAGRQYLTKNNRTVGYLEKGKAP